MIENLMEHLKVKEILKNIVYKGEDDIALYFIFVDRNHYMGQIRIIKTLNSRLKNDIEKASLLEEKWIKTGEMKLQELLICI